MAEWIEIANAGDITPDFPLVTSVAGMNIAVYNLDGNLYAIEDRCTHMDFPVSDGPVEDDTVMCIHHGAKFCIKTGKVKAPPAFEDLTTFPVQIEDGKVKILV